MESKCERNSFFIGLLHVLWLCPASGTSKHGHMAIFDKSEADVTHESCGICSRVGRLIYLNVQQV